MLTRKKIILIAVIATAVIATVLFLIFRKPSKVTIGIDPEFAEYVSAITSGVISSESTIKVILVEPYKGDSANKEEAIKDIFSFSSSIDGLTRWADDRTVEFVPSKPMKSGELYEAEFKLDKIVDVPSRLNTLRFNFRIISQDFIISEDGVRTYPNQGEKYFLSGTIKTADVLDNETCEKLLIASLGSVQMNIRWNHSDNRLTHDFVIDSITRSQQSQTLKLDWNADAIGLDKKGTLDVEIPSIDMFKVIDARQINVPEQFLKIIFSDPIDPNQNLIGLITIENKNELKFSIEDNIVKVYFESGGGIESYRLVVNEGVINYKGKQLADKFFKSVNYQQTLPGVEIMGKGAIMPNDGKVVLPFRAVNLKAVDIQVVKIFENNVAQFLQSNELDGMYELKRVGRPILKQKIDLVSDHAIDYSVWNNFSVELSKLIKTDPGAIYRITLSFKKSYSLYPCTGKDSTNQEGNEDEIFGIDEEADNSSWDNPDSYEYEYYYYYEGYYENRDNPCHKAYYNNERFPSCNILASNLGITAKLNKNKDLVVIVTDLRDTKPVSGANIEVLDYQQQVIAKGSTSSDGFAMIKVPHQPYLLVVNNGDERGYLSLKGNSSLSITNFDVSGEEIQKGLKGFIYGERGVWRPGDTLFLSFILEDKNKTLPAAHPVIMELTDPKGRLYKKLVKTSSVNGFYTFTIPTEEKVPTGNWNAKVRAGGASFYKTIRVETIKPNRLEINLDFANGKNYITPNIQGKLSAVWLHGAKASNLKARITATLSKTSTSFKKYPNFIFDDMSREFKSDEQDVFEGTLNEEGVTNVAAKLTANNEFPGFIKAAFLTKVFEQSGDFSSDAYSITLSPYDYYVGMDIPYNRDYSNILWADTSHIIPIVTVDKDGNPASRTGLSVNVYKLEWRWWWDGADNDMATYFSNSYHSPVISTYAVTTNGKGNFNLNIKEEGRYLVKVTDQAGHSTSQIAYVYWPWWRSRDNGNTREGATILSISSDKPKYTVGETAYITVPLAYKDNVLVSIESGSKIVKLYWSELKNVKDNRGVLEVPVTADMTPNVYINVTIFRKYAEFTNEAPLRVYGYTPIEVEDKETVLEPQLTAPEQVGSEQPIKLTVKEAKGKPMTYTLAVVDEGLLGITRFKTPDPHSTFYVREALGIKTWDMYNLVFGAYGGDIEQIFGIGGDGELAGMKGKKNAERFKPIVKVIGPFTLKSGASNNHTVTLPKYNGAVRVMLVAGQDGAYGNAEKTVKIKDPLMVTATLPRVLSPGELVEMPVTIFADDPSIKSVKLDVTANNLLIPLNGTSKTIQARSDGSTITSFSFKSAEAVGIVKVKVTARSGNLKADFEVELNLRNPNPPVTEFSGYILQPGQSNDNTLQLPGMKGTNSLSIEASTLPPIDLNRHLGYLIHYPYGCIEQTTSSVFPQLYLADILYLTDNMKAKTDENVKAGINRIKGFQTSEGGFSYWQGGYYISEWGTNYAGHFLVEAEKAGYSLPSGIKDAWIKYQQTRARNWTQDRSNYYFGNEMIQAYRLYTLALAGKPEIGAMNRLQEQKNLCAQSQWQLAAAYILAGQPEIGSKIIASAPKTVPDYYETGYTYGSGLRDQAMLLETMSLMKDFSNAAALAEQIATRLSKDGWFSTQTVAYSLVSMMHYKQASGMGKGNFDFALSIDGSPANSYSSKSSIYVINPDVTNKTSVKLKMVNKTQGAIYIRYCAKGAPAIGQEKDASSNITMDVAYKDIKGNVINPAQVKQGSDFKMQVTLKNIWPGIYMENLALNAVIPSGWEIVNTRLTGTDDGSNQSAFDYQDIRDDRITTFFSLKYNEVKTFVFTLNASYKGQYYMPVVNCEAMYDNRIYARKQGMWVKIE